MTLKVGDVRNIAFRGQVISSKVDAIKILDDHTQVFFRVGPWLGSGNNSFDWDLKQFLDAITKAIRMESEEREDRARFVESVEVPES